MNMAIEVEFSKDMLEYEYPGAVVTPFERVINAFEHYNCDHERGRYIHYYEFWEDDLDDGTDRDEAPAEVRERGERGWNDEQ